MDPFCYQILKSNPDLLRFVRFNPIWYRYLSRDPQYLLEIEKAAKQFYGKTLPQRLAKMGQQIEMASMLFQLAHHMKEIDE